MTILVAGNKNYGLSASVNKVCSDATFLSRTTGYDLTSSDIQQQVALMSLEHQVFLSISCLHSFNQIELIKKVIDTWIAHKHAGYLIAIGSSADTPVNGNSKLYPIEKRAVRTYLRQISQICSGENPVNFKVTYLSPGNLHTPSMDRKLPTTLKLDCDYVAGIISWLIDQPANVNISEFCLDRIQQ